MESVLEQIQRLGYRCKPFVIRVEDQLDIFLPSYKWRNIKTGWSGRSSRREIEQLLFRQLGDSPNVGLHQKS